MCPTSIFKMSKSMRVSVEVDVHSVTCPGVWFPCKSPVYLSICFLGFHVKTKPFPAAFPLLFGDKFVFEKTFPGKWKNSIRKNLTNILGCSELIFFDRETQSRSLILKFWVILAVSTFVRCKLVSPLSQN